MHRSKSVFLDDVTLELFLPKECVSVSERVGCDEQAMLS